MYLAYATAQAKSFVVTECETRGGLFFSIEHSLARIIRQLVNTVLLLLCLFRILHNELQLLDLLAVVKPIVTYLIITEEEMCAEEPFELTMSKKRTYFHHEQLHMNEALMFLVWGLLLHFLIIFVCEENYLYAIMEALFKQFSLCFCAKQMITYQCLGFNYSFGDKLIFSGLQSCTGLSQGMDGLMKWSESAISMCMENLDSHSSLMQLIISWLRITWRKSLFHCYVLFYKIWHLTLVSSISYRSITCWETLICYFLWIFIKCLCVHRFVHLTSLYTKSKCVPVIVSTYDTSFRKMNMEVSRQIGGWFHVISQHTLVSCCNIMAKIA